MSRIVICNACVLPMNDNMDVFRNGSILIEDGQIRKICRGEIREEYADIADIMDAKGMIVMPGFINTHTHLPMTMFRGFADDLLLHTWLNKYIFPAEAKMITPENVIIASRLALIEMIQSGTVCFNDMYFFEDIIATEAEKAGIRGVMNESLIDFRTPSFHTVEEGLVLSKRLIDKWKGHPTIHPSVVVHSPYTCSKETLLKAKKLADKQETLLQIHVAETEREVADVMKQTGMPPAEYLHSIGFLDKNVIAAHCIWLNEKEVQLFAQSGTKIAHCPKSNLKLGSGVADIYRYMQKGITVSVGTDGTASNNTLDMIEELRFASLLPKGKLLNPEAVNSREAVRMATINGAKALGLDKITGSLEPGKSADLIMIEADALNMLPVYDEFSAVVYAMNSNNVVNAMVHGKWIMKNRNVLHIDKEHTVQAIKKICINDSNT